MKILIVAPYFFEPHRWMISAYKTALYLSKKNKVVVLTTGSPSYQKLNPNLVIYRMRDIFIPDPVNYSIVIGLFWYLLKVIKKEKPDIFLVNKHMFYTSFSILWLRILGKKVFCQIDTFPGINWFPKSNFVKFVMKIYARTIGIFLLKISNMVILLHEGLIPIAKKYKLNHTVIHNGVDFDKLKKSKPAKDLLPKKKNELRIVYVGRLESVKGYNDLLKAALRISKKEPGAKFYFVGSCQGKGKIVKKYQSEKIIFLGHREDIFSILKTMDIFVLPSYSEGLPNALMEAMACGLVCLSSNVGGVKVLIKEGETGLLFKPGDSFQIEKKLLKLIKSPDLREKLDQKARLKIEKDFNWKIISCKLISLFKKNKN